MLLDCGLHQGPRSEANRLNSNFPIDAKSVNAVVLSHAHLDHCGMLPVLVREGFTGKIYISKATTEIAEYILQDSTKTQEQDADYLDKQKGVRDATHAPLYTLRDVAAVLPYFSPEDFDSVSGSLYA